MIKAPYNFVPLNKNVFFPEDTNLISQDVPFSEGKSGTITIKITAESPMFVSDKQNNGQTEYFCHTPAENQNDWKYFIPGTSIKGAVRNVMEILSFSKMRFVQNQVFTIRDLYRGTKKEDDESILSDGDFYLNKLNADNIHCGWMKMRDNSCYIDDCGKPWRISAAMVDAMLSEKGLTMDFGSSEGLDNFVKYGDFSSSNTSNRYAKAKYEALRRALGCNDAGFYQSGGLDTLFETLTTSFTDDEDTATDIKPSGRIFKCASDTGKEGTVVFTGQPGARREYKGKYFEFIFPSSIQAKGIPVYDNVLRSFMRIHKDSHKETKPNSEFLLYLLKAGNRIPVFFVYTDEQKTKIDAIGLSYLFRYPAFNSVYNGITPLELLDMERPDLPECIFGYTTRKDSLKGRVSFSHAFLQGTPRVLRKNYALSSPYPSFYPVYLGNGQSWNSQSIRIAGRKRYPVRNIIESNKGSEGMNKPIRPLATGSEFSGRINFFNLRPFELGALLSSLDFCGKNECHHSLGQGKPLGYGKCKIVIEDVSFSSPIESHIDTATYRESFEDVMNNESVKKNWPEKWEDSVQLRELFAMARGIPNGQDDYFTYMKLKSKDEKEPTFEKAKKAYKDNNEQLGRFSHIIINPQMKHTYSATQDMASLQDERLDIESYLLCKERISEIVDAGILPDEITAEELVWMEGVLRQFQDENGEDNALLSAFSLLIASKKKEFEERLAKEEEEAKVRMAEKEKEDQARMAQEKEDALKQKEVERLAKNKAKNDWKKAQQALNEKETASVEVPPTADTVIGFTDLLAQALSVGQLTKIIENIKKEGRNTLQPDELQALSKGIRSVALSLKGKMNKAEFEQKDPWVPNGSIWKKLANLVGPDVFASAFPEFTDDEKK